MTDNFVFIEGNLTRDPDTKYTQAGKTVINFSIAHNNRKKEGDTWVDGEPDFFDCEYWPSDPQYWLKRLGKGAAVIITGELKQDRWEFEGKTMSRVKIRVTSIGAKWLPELTGQKAATSSDKKPESAKPSPPKDEFTDDIPF